VGIIQFFASASEGLWYARSEEVLQSTTLVTLRWIRTLGDIVFIVGGVAVSWQVIKGVFFTKKDTNLITNPSSESEHSKHDKDYCCGSCSGDNN
jgi:nitric oxide reductase subunit B